MPRNAEIMNVDEDTGDMDVRLEETDGTIVEFRLRLTAKDDGTIYSEDEMLDFVADHWPDEEFERKRRPKETDVTKAVGRNNNMQTRLTARGR